MRKDVIKLFVKLFVVLFLPFEIFNFIYSLVEFNYTGNAMTKFRKEYGIIPKVSDRTYFTNSIHVPVYKQMSPFKKIDIESQLTGLSNAGCITYVELSHEAIHNIEALEQLVDYAMEHDIPYFAINLPSSSCLACGYQGDIDDNCPECGSKNIEKLARVTGYLSTDYRHFNQGKIDEVHDRVKHKETYNF